MALFLVSACEKLFETIVSLAIAWLAIVCLSVCVCIVCESLSFSLSLSLSLSLGQTRQNTDRIERPLLLFCFVSDHVFG